MKDLVESDKKTKDIGNLETDHDNRLLVTNKTTEVETANSPMKRKDISGVLEDDGPQQKPLWTS